MKPLLSLLVLMVTLTVLLAWSTEFRFFILCLSFGISGWFINRYFGLISCSLFKMLKLLLKINFGLSLISFTPFFDLLFVVDNRNFLQLEIAVI